MAGLIRNQTPLAAQPGQQPEPQEETNVTPEEQAQYDEFVDKGYQLLYGKTTFQQMVQRATAGGDPIEGLASVVVLVVRRLEETASGAGKKISPDVMFHGGTELLEDFADTLSKAGMHDYTAEEIEGALYRAMDIYREQTGQAGGEVKPEVAADWQALQQADRTGEIDRIFPGLKEKFAGKAPAPSQGGV